MVQKEGAVDILMEYIPCGSIRYILNNFISFKEKLVRSYTKQILEALVKGHEKGICHGDLKSTNILIDDLGILKLNDYSFIKRTFTGPKHISKYRKAKAFEDDTKVSGNDRDIPLIGSE